MCNREEHTQVHKVFASTMTEAAQVGGVHPDGASAPGGQTAGPAVLGLGSPVKGWRKSFQNTTGNKCN